MAAGCNGDDDCEEVAIVAAIALSGLSSAVIGWLRPTGALGAAFGATLGLCLVMLLFRTTRWPFSEAAAFGGLVAVGELCGVAARFVFGRARGWGRS
jgi:hypothetical protein